MKIGSIVECVKPTIGDENHKPLLKGYYTIRALRTLDDVDGVLLEEIVNGYNECWRVEHGYKANRFREIEFPPLLEAEIQECLTREFELV